MVKDDFGEQFRKFLNNAAPAEMGVTPRTPKDEEIALRLDALAIEQGYINSVLSDFQNRIEELEQAEYRRTRWIEEALKRPGKELKGWRRWLAMLTGH